MPAHKTSLMTEYKNNLLVQKYDAFQGVEVTGDILARKLATDVSESTRQIVIINRKGGKNFDSDNLFFVN